MAAPLFVMLGKWRGEDIAALLVVIVRGSIRLAKSNWQQQGTFLQDATATT